MRTLEILLVSTLMIGTYPLAAEDSEPGDATPRSRTSSSKSATDGAIDSRFKVTLESFGQSGPADFDGYVSDLTYDALSDHLQRMASHEESLGERRRRRLWMARSYLERYELGAVPHEDPYIDEEVEDIVSHCVLKLMRVRLEKEIGLNGLRDRLRGRVGSSDDGAADGAADGGLGSARSWSISPRAGVGHDPWLGTKLRWRTDGDRSSLRQADVTFGFKRHLLHDETSFGVEMETDDLNLELAHILDAERSGDTYLLSVRWQF